MHERGKDWRGVYRASRFLSRRRLAIRSTIFPLPLMTNVNCFCYAFFFLWQPSSEMFTETIILRCKIADTEMRNIHRSLWNCRHFYFYFSPQSCRQILQQLRHFFRNLCRKFREIFPNRNQLTYNRETWRKNVHKLLKIRFVTVPCSISDFYNFFLFGWCDLVQKVPSRNYQSNNRTDFYQHTQKPNEFLDVLNYRY